MLRTPCKNGLQLNIFHEHIRDVLIKRKMYYYFINSHESKDKYMKKKLRLFINHISFFQYLFIVSMELIEKTHKMYTNLFSRTTLVDIFSLTLFILIGSFMVTRRYFRKPKSFLLLIGPNQ